jgi:D-glycero-D-manno-heptose 1,7-bisphosphate phosphatase
MNKAVFLDRDGVINIDIKDYTYRLEDFKIIDGVIEAMKIFSEKGYLLIVITNQGGIAKRLYGHQQVAVLHGHLETILSKENILLTDIYYCPHHPVTGNCICRKPDSLLLEKAIARYEIDPSLSYFIGDRERDVIAGEKAGVHTIMIETNSSLLDIAHLIK